MTKTKRKTKPPMKLTRRHARKVLEVVDQGLCYGIGEHKPGAMCVEAAVCYALGLPHGDNPPCVHPTLRDLKIRLNDLEGWDTSKLRARGLRRLAILQLGTHDGFDPWAFRRNLRLMLATRLLPHLVNTTVLMPTFDHYKQVLLNAAAACKTATGKALIEAVDWVQRASMEVPGSGVIGTVAICIRTLLISRKHTVHVAVNIATHLGRAYLDSWIKQRKDAYAWFAEEVVQILIAMEVPAVKWLDLTEEA
jgi:hypothetical protein